MKLLNGKFKKHRNFQANFFLKASANSHNLLNIQTRYLIFRLLQS